VKTSFGARIFVVALAFIALLGASGCAASNRESFMRERAGEHVYQRPLPEVWEAAKQLLAEDGFSGREVQGGWVFVTEWKEASGESSLGSRFTRYLVEGRALGQARSIIRFTKVLRATGSTGAGIGDTEGSTHAGMAPLSGGGAGSDAPMGVPKPEQEGRGPKSALATGQRDLEMEWRLLQKIEPAKARAIEGEALLEYPD
jgi:hypothetical protein